MQASYHSTFQDESGEISQKIEALRRSGILLEPWSPACNPAPILLFFDGVNTDLYDFLLHERSQDNERILVIAVSPQIISSECTWRLLHAGVADVLTWNISSDPISAIFSRLQRWDAIDEIVRSPRVRNNLIGVSQIWLALLRRIIEVAKFTNASVLLLGETGTGKELLARLIHTLDPRPDKGDLVVVDCTTIVPDLAGSEFFGHERGAFTGASSARDGAFAMADRGTLLLDEIGELPLSLQAQVLRVIQEGAFKRVGGNSWRQTDFRLICATNRDLLREVELGRFRRDLYYRISATSFHISPLRERKEDILPLADHFVRASRPDEEWFKLDDSVIAYLLSFDYRGNVRELKQLVTRIMQRHVGPGPITVGDIPEEDRPTPDCDLIPWCDSSMTNAILNAIYMGVGLKEIRETITETAVRLAESIEGGNLKRASI